MHVLACSRGVEVEEVEAVEPYAPRTQPRTDHSWVVAFHYRSMSRRPWLCENLENVLGHRAREEMPNYLQRCLGPLIMSSLVLDLG